MIGIKFLLFYNKNNFHLINIKIPTHKNVKILFLPTILCFKIITYKKYICLAKLI